MSATTYKQFLAAPSSSLLADGASLHYVTTTTSYSGPTDIIKHLNTLRNQVKKKKEDVLEVVEGLAALAAQVDTTLEFVTSGGAYLPGLDDNFLSDRTVHLPIMHIVTFDAAGKILQIRQSWDQGSLLKQLDIIGKSGRNWPIRDSREQLKMLESCLKATGKIEATQDPNDLINRSRGNSQNALRDPHASLALFAPREEVEQIASAAVVSPYAGARPHQRSFTDVLGDEGDESGPMSPSAGRERSMSPSKAVAPKIGAGKNFHPMRLFGNGEENSEEPDTPEKKTPAAERFYRPNPAKYQHFDFADGSDPQDAPRAGVPFEQKPKSKHDSTWGFEDFVTPAKTAATRGLHRHQDVRHWDTAETAEDVNSQPQRGGQKPRRDAETHFEFKDDGEPSGEPRLVSRPRGAAHNKGLGLYENNLYSEDGSALPAEPTAGRALGNITNIKDRRKDFDAHFSMTDDSPSTHGAAPVKVSEDRMKAVRMMDANWAATDESPSQKENKPQNGSNAATAAAIKAATGKDGDERGIRIAGDGMGGPIGSDRSWLYGGGDDTPRAVPNKKPNAVQANKSFWDF